MVIPVRSALAAEVVQDLLGLHAGVEGGLVDKFPLGALMEKGLQVRSGQTHVQRYTGDLLRRIQEGEIDTTFLISHRLPLEDAARGYRNFKEKQDSWTKVVLKPAH